MNRKPKDTLQAKLSWWEATLRGQRSGLLAQSFRRAAKLGSLGYKAGVRGREVAYQRGWLPVKRLPRPTVCVGNITVGGTGKTPLVIRLVSDLLQRGCRPAVLLRGYKREVVTDRPVLVRDAKRVLSSVREAGDEAMELALRLPGACVGVGADRYAVGHEVLKHTEVDCFILDDGFQHHRLDRDLNLVTIDVTDPWGGGQLLPAGLLRESPDALRRAHLVVLTRTGQVAPDRLSVLRAEVASFIHEKAALLESKHEPKQLISLLAQKEHPLSFIKGKEVLAVSGIANPQSFEMSLSALGADVGSVFRLSDHGGSPEEVWTWISKRRKPKQWVIMTEKDAMRWTTAAVPASALAHTLILRMDLVITSGEEIWEKMIGRLSLRHAATR